MGRGGGFSDIVIRPDNGGWAAGHEDFASGEVLVSMSDGGSVITEVIGQAAVGDHFTTLEADPVTGTLNVAYYDNTVGELFFGVRTGPDNWDVELVPDPENHDNGDFSRMDVDFEGRPHIVYVDYDADEIRYAFKNNNQWFVQPVAPLNGAVPWLAMELNGFGQPNMAWTDQNAIFYARLTPVGWRVELVANDAAGHTFTSCDLKMDGDDDPVIVYVNSLNQSTVARFDGLDWQLEPTLTAQRRPVMISAAVDDGNNMHMTYYEPAGSNLRLVYVTRFGGQWAQWELDADVGTTNTLGTSIGLTAQHTPCVSYTGSPEGNRRELRVACIGIHCQGDTNCDGVINAFDIEPFLLALFEPELYEERFPDCDIRTADIDGNGKINSFDIEPLLELLFGP